MRVVLESLLHFFKNKKAISISLILITSFNFIVQLYMSYTIYKTYIKDRERYTLYLSCYSFDVSGLDTAKTVDEIQKEFEYEEIVFVDRESLSEQEDIAAVSFFPEVCSLHDVIVLSGDFRQVLSQKHLYVNLSARDILGHRSIYDFDSKEINWKGETYTVDSILSLSYPGMDNMDGFVVFEYNDFSSAFVTDQISFQFAKELSDADLNKLYKIINQNSDSCNACPLLLEDEGKQSMIMEVIFLLLGMLILSISSVSVFMFLCEIRKREFYIWLLCGATRSFIKLNIYTHLTLFDLVAMLGVGVLFCILSVVFPLFVSFREASLFFLINVLVYYFVVIIAFVFRNSFLNNHSKQNLYFDKGMPKVK